MNHNTAVRRLRTIAVACADFTSGLGGRDGLVAVYAFGPCSTIPVRSSTP